MKFARTGTTLAVAATAATAAYGVGVQSQDGNAVAKSGKHHSKADGRADHRGKHGLARAARKLGVSTAQLRAALKDVRAQQADGPTFAAELAKALAVDEARVKAAFKEARASRSKASFAETVAKSLGVEAAQVKAAMKSVRQAHQAERRREYAAALAKALDRPVEDVERALAAQRDGRADRRGGRDFARALGVSRDQVKDALKSVARAQKAERRAEYREFVAALAARLDVTPKQVRRAFPSPSSRDRDDRGERRGRGRDDRGDDRGRGRDRAED